MASEDSSNSVRAACSCQCCPFCKARIVRLENMVNKLFTILKDYLPEQVLNIHQRYLQLQQDNNSRLGKSSQNHKNSRGRKSNSENRGHINSQQMHKTGKQQNQKEKIRKTLPLSQKKLIVQKVQQCLRNGEKVVAVCQRFGISDRSYQRWKMKIDYGSEESNQSSQEVVIIHANV